MGYVTVESSRDVLAWSGLNAHILAALNGAGMATVVVDALAPVTQLVPRLRAKWHSTVLGRRSSR